ncbi:GNAT family N-acetyltransferase [Tissierella sp. Yu-01]|uniref:GNAT family N-acetyltransferase n=1 Tax=Tissierella sp. Yu-01 TaxID=3035694 RepID=UPI00240D1D3B|nr:GNAT family N-acetyltransferase [Tissierella sp. Yu-01]WFA09040.1 GNAT family N-acetyltransferase [Tissierella sp. Yu-01]
MLNFKTLEEINIETLHAAFVQAFLDYQVEINLPLWKFNNMLQRRGYSPELSVGAFKDSELIGFVLNGIRNWRGKTTIYDCGTGVIPEYRKQGITSNMFKEVLRHLQSNNIEHYLLEVIQSNEPAVNLYEKQGFLITRTFSCFRIEKDHIRNGSISSIKYKSCNIEEINWKLFKSFWDFEPSWQNSIESIIAVSNSFEAVTAQIGEDIIGYGIIDKITGDIPQLAVHIKYRRQGIGANIFKKLIEYTESQNISFINIENKCLNIIEFLHNLGFENFIDQYEMILNI